MPEDKRVHHTRTEKLCTTRTYDQQPHELKPRGLWYAMGDAWADWCTAEEYADTGSMNCFELDLDLENILVLDDTSRVREFAEEFTVQSCFIDWPEVVSRWKGIEIPDYTRFLGYEPNMLWYHSLDVSGGCVWDLSAVERVERINETCVKD